MATRDGAERWPLVGQGNDNVPADREAIAQQHSSWNACLIPAATAPPI
jgi:hypothetical protein